MYEIVKLSIVINLYIIHTKPHQTGCRRIGSLHSSRYPPSVDAKAVCDAIIMQLSCELQNAIFGNLLLIGVEFVILSLNLKHS